jgi:hypothetical protein
MEIPLASVLPPKIEVHRQAACIGNHMVPTGVVKCAHIYPGMNIVRLWCENGAMGIQEGTVLDFRLQTDARVKKFVAGLLKQTEACLISIGSLKTEFVGGSGDAERVRAEFVLANPEDAQIFANYIAPQYFDGCEGILCGRTLTVISQEGTRSAIIKQMKKAFVELNIHANHTLSDALSQNDQSPFYVPRTPRDSECYSSSPDPLPHYAITQDQILKGCSCGCSMNPLEFEPFIAHGLFSELISTKARIDRLIDAFPMLRDRFAPFMEVANILITKGEPKDGLELELCKNFFKDLEEPNFDDLGPETSEAIHAMIDNLESVAEVVY